MDVVLAARDTQKLAALAGETGATTIACDASRAAEVDRLFAAVDAGGERLDLVVYNASGRARGPVAELDPEAVENAIKVTAFGGFLVARAAAQRMIKQGHGTILFTGASASVKGYARSSSFAMGKFALRGLAQSLARELQPQNIHVGHIVIDGGIGRPGDPRGAIAAPTRCSIPTRSPTPISTCTASSAAPGPGKSSCGPGSRRSEQGSGRRIGNSSEQRFPLLFPNRSSMSLKPHDYS